MIYYHWFLTFLSIMRRDDLFSNTLLHIVSVILCRLGQAALSTQVLPLTFKKSRRPVVAVYFDTMVWYRDIPPVQFLRSCSGSRIIPWRVGRRYDLRRSWSSPLTNIGAQNHYAIFRFIDKWPIAEGSLHGSPITELENWKWDTVTDVWVFETLG